MREYRKLKSVSRRICTQNDTKICEGIEKLVDSYNSQKFEEEMRRITDGFKTLTHSSLVSDVQSLLSIWGEYFSHL